MRLHYAVLCDYASALQGNKPVLVGIFDLIRCIRNTVGSSDLALPPHFLAGRIEMNSFEIGEHTALIRLVDLDMKILSKIPLKYEYPAPLSQMPGDPAVIDLTFAVTGASVPDFGEYEWEIYVDDKLLGSAKFRVREALIREVIQ